MWLALSNDTGNKLEAIENSAPAKEPGALRSNLNPS